MVDARHRASTTITVMRLSCPLACRHCGYGTYNPVPLATIEELVREIMAAGHLAHFYDMRVTAESLAIMRLTRQFERPSPGWLNVTADFSPSPEDLAYLNGLDLSVLVSLHGSTPALHALLSGREHEHARIVATLRRLRTELRLPLGINYVVHRHNVDDLPAMVEWTRSELPVDFIELINLGFGGSSLTHLDPSFALDAAAALRAYEHVRRLQKRFPRFVQLDAQWGPDFVGVAPRACGIFAAPSSDQYCNAGVTHFALRTDTREVLACPTLATVPAARLGRWENGELVLEHDWAQLTAELGEPCRSCDKRAACGGGCRAIAYCDTALAGEMPEPARLAAGFGHCPYQAYRRGVLKLGGGV